MGNYFVVTIELSKEGKIPNLLHYIFSSEPQQISMEEAALQVLCDIGNPANAKVTQVTQITFDQYSQLLNNSVLDFLSEQN